MQSCTQVSIFLLHFITKTKLTVSNLIFSDAIRNKPTLTNISHTTKSLFCRVRPKQQKNPQAFRATTKKKIGFAIPLKTDNIMTTPCLGAATKASFSDRLTFAESHPYSAMMTDNSRVKPYCHSHTKCKLYYKMGRDWLV